MERLLIVEDEVQIRRGLHAIVGRSGVDIREILECKNGEEALQLLRSVPVDVMFTDVRMPHMDGLELIRAVEELPPGHQPEIVVVSGYDDFNYAVEAMRHGAREYLLKPVERERVYEILSKLDKVVAEKKEKDYQQETISKLSHQQLKYMLLNPDITDEEVSAIKDAFQDLLLCGAYVLFCLNRPVDLAAEESVIQLDGMGVFHILVHRYCSCEAFIGRVLSRCYVGMSSAHNDLADFRAAFSEALEARKYAFFTGKRRVTVYQVSYEEGNLLLQHNPRQLARQVGTREYVGLVHLLNGVFTQAARGKLAPHAFENFILPFLDEIADLFHRIVSLHNGTFEALKTVYGYDTVDAYRLALLEWLDTLHGRIVAESESFRSKERMSEALDFIRHNYDKGLNMAVVSNHISMNYSVFSQLFKEYTGKNFVDYLRDLRMEKAKELLIQTDLRISEISAKTGYENDKYFMKSFKTAMGISPTQYRRLERLKGR